MIEISISRGLAAAHLGFMAGCAERGHAIDVFDNDGPEAQPPETSGGAAGTGQRRSGYLSPAASAVWPRAHTGSPHPELGF